MCSNMGSMEIWHRFALSIPWMLFKVWWLYWCEKRRMNSNFDIGEKCSSTFCDYTDLLSNFNIGERFWWEREWWQKIRSRLSITEHFPTLEPFWCPLPVMATYHLVLDRFWLFKVCRPFLHILWINNTNFHDLQLHSLELLKQHQTRIIWWNILS